MAKNIRKKDVKYSVDSIVFIKLGKRPPNYAISKVLDFGGIKFGKETEIEGSTGWNYSAIFKIKMKGFSAIVKTSTQTDDDIMTKKQALNPESIYYINQINIYRKGKLISSSQISNNNFSIFNVGAISSMAQDLNTYEISIEDDDRSYSSYDDLLESSSSLWDNLFIQVLTNLYGGSFVMNPTFFFGNFITKNAKVDIIDSSGDNTMEVKGFKSVKKTPFKKIDYTIQSFISLYDIHSMSFMWTDGELNVGYYDMYMKAKFPKKILKQLLRKVPLDFTYTFFASTLREIRWKKNGKKYFNTVSSYQNSMHKQVVEMADLTESVTFVAKGKLKGKSLVGLDGKPIKTQSFDLFENNGKKKKKKKKKNGDKKKDIIIF